MDAATTIAKGGQPGWSETFEHPEHGPLTFTVKRLPKVKDWLAHSVAQEQVAPGLRGAAAELAAAVAAMQTFMDVPVIHEERIVDPDEPSHVTLKQHRYDPLEDDDMAFPITVWVSFWMWRIELLESKQSVDAVKNSSGATSGADDGDSSPATTDSTPEPSTSGPRLT